MQRAYRRPQEAPAFRTTASAAKIQLVPQVEKLLGGNFLTVDIRLAVCSSDRFRLNAIIGN